MGIISELFNFDNIGSKIKNWTKWACWINILLIWIASPILFIVFLSDRWLSELCWIPIVVALIGPVLIWVESWFFYAFGEFVEDIHAMRNKEDPTEESNAKFKEKSKLEIEYEAEERATRIAKEKALWKKENESNDNAFSYDDFIDINCPNCRNPLSFLKNETDGCCPVCETKFKIQK